MKRPKTSESKYWGNDRFRHLLFIEDLEDYTTALEEQIAKNCVIPAVVGRSEQLKAFADYAQKRMWEDGNKDLSEFVDEFESL